HVYRPRPGPPPNPPGPPRPGIRGLPEPLGAVVVRVLPSTTPVTTSMPGCNSSLRSSVFVPSVMPSRRVTGFNCLFMYSQARPRDSTGGRGANNASIVSAVCGAPYLGGTAGVFAAGFAFSADFASG